ncbi:hypothetical protein HPP92_013271 [Vanilla planifolia]|uniref:UspA domain-containing protein n=1 Tax=Vanilla planifolia TaxID=51239 RepID=A0A835UYB3_VANPL|nr:hypothetical protein HPP92_013271 [Vanilla planifolia]
MGSSGKASAFLSHLSAGEGDDCNQDSGYEYGSTAMVKNKRVVVVVEPGRRAKFAMMWALTHVASEGDLLTLLYVVPSASSDATLLPSSLGAVCRACRPEVEIEGVVVQGPKLATVLSQVQKLEASVLVVSQGKPSPFCCLWRSSGEEFVEGCIKRAGCLTLAVKRQSRGIGGYVVSTRWHRNFWLAVGINRRS